MSDDPSYTNSGRPIGGARLAFHDRKWEVKTEDGRIWWRPVLTPDAVKWAVANAWWINHQLIDAINADVKQEVERRKESRT
jgi:hypothetical protein